MNAKLKCKSLKRKYVLLHKLFIEIVLLNPHFCAGCVSSIRATASIARRISVDLLGQGHLSGATKTPEASAHHLYLPSRVQLKFPWKVVGPLNPSSAGPILLPLLCLNQKIDSYSTILEELTGYFTQISSIKKN